MATKALTKPRKLATQGRSRATVESLTQATARILVREGFDKASTNRIAEVAGVSIGSLYQYFPGKDALVAAVIDRHHEDLMRVVRKALSDASPHPIAIGVRIIVAAAVQAHRIDPRLHRVLAEQIPRTGRLENVEVFNREAQLLFRAYLQEHRREIRRGDLDVAAFVCGTTIEALSHTVVSFRKGDLSAAAIETLVGEATRLVVGYLQSP